MLEPRYKTLGRRISVISAHLLETTVITGATDDSKLRYDFFSSTGVPRNSSLLDSLSYSYS